MANQFEGYLSGSTRAMLEVDVEIFNDMEAEAHFRYSVTSR